MDSLLLENKSSVYDAVMFDIDDTLIRYSDQSRIEYCCTLLNYAKAIGYIIVIITARPAYSTEFTKEELALNHIDYDHLFFCPPEMKGQIKRNTALNYVLSVGDLPTDLTDSKYGLKVTPSGRAEEIRLLDNSFLF